MQHSLASAAAFVAVHAHGARGGRQAQLCKFATQPARAVCAFAAVPARRRNARSAVVSMAQPETASASTPPKQAGHGHGHGSMMMSKDTGFVAEMRSVAMRLHTKEQAPKEGQAQKPANEKPMPQWKPTKESYLQFLVESKAVYDMMEQLAQAESPIYSKFRKTGLERAEALAKDIKWFESTARLLTRCSSVPKPFDMCKGVTASPAAGAGVEYAKYLNELAAKDPPSFICHFYNVYFAHTAGGRMIGKKISDMILDGHNLEFYQWEGSLEEHMTAVKKSLNEGWNAEEKERCLKETELSFKYSGTLLRIVAGG